METELALSEFLIGQVAQASLWTFLFNLGLCAVLASFLSAVYVKYGHAISNRRAFARNLMVLSMTTLLIITVVQSSLALSLGLIGALSIVRFRAAIKEPEELIYLFLAIATGLGLGANQRIVTVVAFVVIIAALRARDVLTKDRDAWDQSAYLTVSTGAETSLELDVMREVLAAHTGGYRLKRLDRDENTFEAFFLVEFKDEASLSEIERALRAADPAVRITFLDHRAGALAVA